MKALRWILRFIAGLLAGFLLSLVIIWSFQSAGSHVEVPNLLGKSPVEARGILESRGLGIQTAGFGKWVVAQYPAPHTSVRKGRRVYIHLGNGGKIEVPDVKFMMFEDAARTLKASGFEVDPTFVWSEFDEGIVLGTYREGKLVKVLVSKGKRWIGPAPDVRFLPLKLAEEFYRELGVDYDVKGTESGYPSGIVVDQKTTRDFPRAHVDLYVSDGTSFTFFVYTYFRKLPLLERIHTLALPVLDADSGRLIALIKPKDDGTAVFGWMDMEPLHLEVIRWREGSGGLYAFTPTG